VKTVITHFYNEEYLLPWWLEHHKKIFDFGILIDYASTDRSVEICREICPHWQVFPSGNAEFDSSLLDREVEFYERQISGWRIALTTTEFLVGDINKLFIDTKARAQWYIPGIRFTSWNPDGTLDTNKPLWNQIHTGVHYTTDPIAHQCRSLHNFNDIKYEPGRHYLPHNTEDACIFHYAHCIIGKPMIDRRLQIQNKMSQSDKEKGLGTHHYYNKDVGMNLESLQHMHFSFIRLGETDCSETISKLVS
jgi:hypothetical protein